MTEELLAKLFSREFTYIGVSVDDARLVVSGQSIGTVLYEKFDRDESPLNRTGRGSHHPSSEGCGGLAYIRQCSPKTSEENLGGEDRVPFLEFMRKILKWKPGLRSAAKVLLEDGCLWSKTI